MRENLAQVKGIVQEKNANLDVEIIRRDRAILYRIQPRKVLTVRNEALKWKRSGPTEVEKLISTALERNGPQPSTKVFLLNILVSLICCVVVKRFNVERMNTP